MRVLCTLPNAATEISGVTFKPHDKGMVSDDIPADVAFRLGSIPGYEVLSEGALAQDEQKRRGRPRKVEAYPSEKEGNES